MIGTYYGNDEILIIYVEVSILFLYVNIDSYQ